MLAQGVGERLRAALREALELRWGLREALGQALVLPERDTERVGSWGREGVRVAEKVRVPPSGRLGVSLPEVEGVGLLLAQPDLPPEALPEVVEEVEREGLRVPPEAVAAPLPVPGCCC